MRRVVEVLFVLLTLAAGARAAAPATPPMARRPNIIFILADDLGYGDVGVTFQNARDADKPKFATPNLDALAQSGMQLRTHYTGAPVCAPARASLLLGQHAGDCPIRDNQFDKALPDNHTLATVLKAAGYHTAAIGKWGLQGPKPDYPGHPLRHGFDTYFGFLAHTAGHTYYQDAAHPLFDGFTDVTARYLDTYSTDLFTARAKQYLVDQAAHAPGEPFFLYLAYTAPHMPQEIPGNAYPPGGGLHGGLQWPPAPTPQTRDTWYDPACDGPGWGERMKRYGTVIRRMDRGIGDVLQTLRDLHLDANTLVVFTSDNGPSNEKIDPRKFDSWGPFDGFKRDVWEGGVREPTFVVWPGHIAPGQTSPAVTAFWDWMPTFADVAGLAPPAQADGVSLLPLLTGTPGQRSRPFVYEDYYYYQPPATQPGGVMADIYARKHVTGRGVQQMLRQGDFVALRTQIHHADDPWRLYNVVLDPHEDHDLAADPNYTERLTAMRDLAAGVRRPDHSAPRPYDDTPLPAVSVAAAAGGVDADTFAGDWPWVPDFDGLTPLSHKRSNTLDVAALGLPDKSGVRFSGYLNVPADGTYTLWLSDDAGAQLWLNDAHVLDDDFGHDGKPVSATVVLRAGLHPLRLFYRHGVGTPTLHVEIAGPGLDRQPISPALLAAPAGPSPRPS